MKKILIIFAASAGLCDINAFAQNIYESHRLSEIPVPVMQELSRHCGGCRFADIGEPFNPTDVIDGRQPNRRLVRAWDTDGIWTIEYEHGGRALHRHTVTFATVPTVSVLKKDSCHDPDSDRCDW